MAYTKPQQKKTVRSGRLSEGDQIKLIDIRFCMVSILCIDQAVQTHSLVRTVWKLSNVTESNRWI